jgi:hypothetical protein
VKNDRTIARWRLHRQRLAGSDHPSVPEAVSDLLGVQAENYAQTVWAVAERVPGTTEAGFGELFDAGEILRTHVLRPTWHFVHRDDLVWLLELTAPRVRGSLVQLQRSLGLEESTMEQSDEAIVAMLEEGKHLTRDEIGRRLRAVGLPAEGMALGAMLSHAELEALVCSGVREGDTQTYALVEERAPGARRLDRDEALAEIVWRYFDGHAPATERDLAYWAQLTLTDVRAGLEAVGNGLESFQHDRRTYWHSHDPPVALDAVPDPPGHLLLILDEYYRGYQDSRHVLDAARLEPAGNRAVGMALIDGQMVGNMRRTLRTSSVRFEVELYRELSRDERAALQEAALRYGAFLDLEPEVVFGQA